MVRARVCRDPRRTSCQNHPSQLLPWPGRSRRKWDQLQGAGHRSPMGPRTLCVHCPCYPSSAHGAEPSAAGTGIVALPPHPADTAHPHSPSRMSWGSSCCPFIVLPEDPWQHRACCGPRRHTGPCVPHTGTASPEATRPPPPAGLSPGPCHILLPKGTAAREWQQS